MKVADISPVAAAPERAAAPQAPSSGTAQGARDRVSVEATRGAESSISSAKRTSGTDRASRLQKLEASVRSGTYAPDASRVAEQILSDAEVDARLQAIMTR